MNPLPPTPGAPQPTSQPGAPTPHPAEARVRELETQLARQAQGLATAERFNARLLAVREADPEGYRYIVQKLVGQPGVDPAQAAPASPEQTSDAPENPQTATQAAPALPREVQAALGQIGQLAAMVQALQAELAGLKTRNLQSDVDGSLAEIDKMIADPEVAKQTKAALRKELEENPGLARVPGVIARLARSADYQGAQERAVKKALAEEQARQARMLSLRGVGGLRGLSADAGAAEPLPKSFLEAMDQALSESMNGTPAAAVGGGR